MENSVDIDQATRSVATDVGLYCLHRPVWLSEILGHIIMVISVAV